MKVSLQAMQAAASRVQSDVGTERDREVAAMAKEWQAAVVRLEAVAARLRLDRGLSTLLDVETVSTSASAGIHSPLRSALVRLHHTVDSMESLVSGTVPVATATPQPEASPNVSAARAYFGASAVSSVASTAAVAQSVVSVNPPLTSAPALPRTAVVLSDTESDQSDDTLVMAPQFPVPLPLPMHDDLAPAEVEVAAELAPTVDSSLVSAELHHAMYGVAAAPTPAPMPVAWSAVVVGVVSGLGLAAAPLLLRAWAWA